jgi:hypothetical protein
VQVSCHTSRDLATRLGVHSDLTNSHGTAVDFVRVGSSGVMSLGMDIYYPSMTLATRSDVPQPQNSLEPTESLNINPENVPFIQCPGFTIMIAHQGDLNLQRVLDIELLTVV